MNKQEVDPNVTDPSMVHTLGTALKLLNLDEITATTTIEDVQATITVNRVVEEEE